MKTDIIKASEIGQYNYCSIAWNLQRKGIKPKSDFLEEGTKKHIELGENISRYQQSEISSRWYWFIGSLFSLIAFALLIIFIFLL